MFWPQLRGETFQFCSFPVDNWRGKSWRVWGVSLNILLTETFQYISTKRGKVQKSLPLPAGRSSRGVSRMTVPCAFHAVFSVRWSAPPWWTPKGPTLGGRSGRLELFRYRTILAGRVGIFWILLFGDLANKSFVTTGSENSVVTCWSTRVDSSAEGRRPLAGIGIGTFLQDRRTHKTSFNANVL